MLNICAMLSGSKQTVSSVSLAKLVAVRFGAPQVKHFPISYIPMRCFETLLPRIEPPFDAWTAIVAHFAMLR